MNAVGLFAVLALAKAAVLAGHAGPLLAYLWQDALAALAFLTLQRLTPKRTSITVYWILVTYSALNIPVMRAVATPLTIPMLRAAGGPLADSFRLYATWANAALVASVIGIAALAAIWPKLPTQVSAALLSTIAVLGRAAAASADDSPLTRNVAAMLLAGALPHLTAQASSPPASDREPKTSPFTNAPAEDLSSLRGIARGRNIVMISLESTAAQYLRLYGSEIEVMPHLSELARHAIVFDNAYAVYPESIKGLYSVLCSAYPPLDSEPESFEHSPCRSIAQKLADTGYRTAMFHSGRFSYLGMESVIRDRGYQTLEDAGDIGGNHRSSFGVDEPATVARMLAWIDSLPLGQNFFLTYLPIAGHHPYYSPERGPFPEPDDLGRYRNALHYGDESLGALRDALRARGLDRNTVWLIYGDHGEAFGQHPGNYAHTFFLYEENVHVPLLIVAPDIPLQRHVQKVVSLVDVAPTLLDLAGIPAARDYQGASMLPPQPHLATFYTDYSLKFFGLRDGPWKMIYEPGHSPQLFDLSRDPEERRNLESAKPEQVEWYRQAVLGRIR